MLPGAGVALGMPNSVRNFEYFHIRVSSFLSVMAAREINNAGFTLDFAPTFRVA